MKKDSLKPVLLFLIVALPCLAANCEDNKPEHKPGHYIDKQKKFEITFPQKWTIKKDKFDIDVIAFSPVTGPNDGFRDYIQVYSKKVPEGKNADEVLDANISSMINAITDFQPGKRDHYKIGEREAASLEYKFRQGRFKLSGKAYALTTKGRAYLIYTVAERKSRPLYEKSFAKTVDSFRVIK